MQQKDLRKLCAKLREDRLIAVYASAFGAVATDRRLTLAEIPVRRSGMARPVP